MTAKLEYNPVYVTSEEDIAIGIVAALRLKSAYFKIRDSYIEKSNTPVYYIWVKASKRSQNRLYDFCSGYDTCYRLKVK